VAAERIVCQGEASGHLQGFDSDGEFIYWSMDTDLIKTDFTGKVVAEKAVDPHDLPSVRQARSIAPLEKSPAASAYPGPRPPPSFARLFYKARISAADSSPVLLTTMSGCCLWLCGFRRRKQH
jgi:hypothetical protein